MKKIIFSSFFLFSLSLNIFAQTERIEVKLQLVAYEKQRAKIIYDEGVNSDYAAPRATFNIIEPKEYRDKQVEVIFTKTDENWDKEPTKREVMDEVAKKVRHLHHWNNLYISDGPIYSCDIPKDFLATKKSDIYEADINNFKKEK